MTRDDHLPDMDGRPGVKFAHSTPEHPKIVGLSDAAFRAWFDAICYCSRLETDGRITGAAMRKIAQGKVLRELIGCGLVDDLGDDEYEVHDYLAHQRSRSEINAYRESRQSTGALGAHKRWHVAQRKRSKDCSYCLQGVGSA